MENKEVFVSFLHDSFGSIDVKISREISIKKIIPNFFDAISQPIPADISFYIKAVSTSKLISPNNTLEEMNIYDGEILKLL